MSKDFVMIPAKLEKNLLRDIKFFCKSREIPITLTNLITSDLKKIVKKHKVEIEKAKNDPEIIKLIDKK